MKKPNKNPKLRERQCVICGKIFYKHISPSEIKLGRGVVCSKECKGLLNGVKKKNGFYKKCERCGKDFWVSYSKEKYHHPKYCSRYCYIPTKPMESIAYDGYKVFNGKKVHRIIMENNIGRKLLTKEIVHHIDGNKLNNNIDNLQILTREEHNKIHFSINDGLTNIQRYKLRHGGFKDETEKAKQIDKASYSADIKAKG